MCAVEDKLEETSGEKALKDKLAEMQEVLRNGNKPPIFFIGSGLSRRYLNAPNWEELLKCIAVKAKCNYKEVERLCNNEFEEIAQELEYFCFKNANECEEIGHRQIIRKMIADILQEKVEKYIKENNGQMNEEFNKKIEERLHKIEKLTEDNDIQYAREYDDITNEIKEYTYNIKKAIEIKEFQKINPKAIITTNYDTLLENIIFKQRCNVRIGQKEFSSILDEHKIDLYKIHGCVTKPESIIITKEDYDNFFRKSKYLYSKIFTLLWEYPVVFIGYSISDRNIKDILTAMIDIMTVNDKKKFLERIWIVDFVKHEEDEGVIEKEIELLNGKKIKVCCFCLKYYDKFYKAINEIGFSQQFGELKFTTSKNVIELLIEPLYQQQEKLKVVTRELLQNALDACKMKGVSANIEITISEGDDKDSGKMFLKIEDNGIGMNPQELRENFLTVGKSNKNNSNKGLVGKYGIGILSVFLIGDYAEVYTKKSDNVLLPLKIYIEGNEKRVEWLDGNPDIGKGKESFTIVKIRLNGEMHEKLRKENLKDILKVLGLEMYVTKPEYNISVEYNNEKKEIPKINKEEWFLEISPNIKIYKGASCIIQI